MTKRLMQILQYQQYYSTSDWTYSRKTFRSLLSSIKRYLNTSFIPLPADFIEIALFLILFIHYFVLLSSFSHSKVNSLLRLWSCSRSRGNEQEHHLRR